MSLVRNGQTKLTATCVNGIAIALFAVGTLTPNLSVMHGDRGVRPLLILGMAVCLAASGASHFGARRIPQGLES